jgi:acyl-coenzyme A synthetase/AMP-(fatty) acid ligase
MYGLTEAFRSTYLPPSEVDKRPDSIGKAIPNAEVLVVRPDGTVCDPGEPGELVHRGPLVSLGYWNDPARTAERFKPAPGQPEGIPLTEMAVWSGDTVMRDEEGFLYFVGRRDEMIKTSGYRVSPTEVEEVIFASGQVRVAAAIGVEHAQLGQAIVVFAAPVNGSGLQMEAITAYCRAQMPSYMVPHRIIERDDMPTNPNGKIDRKKLAEEVATLFKGQA